MWHFECNGGRVHTQPVQQRITLLRHGGRGRGFHRNAVGSCGEQIRFHQTVAASSDLIQSYPLASNSNASSFGPLFTMRPLTNT